MKKRSEIQEKDTWKLEDILAGDQEWEELFGQCSQQIQEYGSFKGRLKESKETLYQCLEFDGACSLNVERLYVYARMRLDQDTAQGIYQDMFGRAQSLSVQAASASSFLVPEILEIPDETLKQYMETYPPLSKYRRLLEMILRRREHTLSAEAERLLARSQEATQGGSQVFAMFNNADVRFPSIAGPNGQEQPVTHGNYISLMENPDRRIRRDAFMSLYSVYRQFQNTLAAAFEANVKQAVFYASVRGYASSRQYYLGENEVPEQVYDNLLKVIRDSLPLLHRYVKIRKECLGLDEIHMYDLYAPMVASSRRRYTLEEAKETVALGLAPLGEEYIRILREGFDSRWIDVYENQGKRTGAYSWGVYGSHPYVLMNFQGTLNDVFTLAHEMGHSLHTYFSDQAQPYVYAGYKIFVAEVASTCNEALLIRHLLSQAKDNQEKLYLLNHFLESFRATVFRQTMFAEFEYKVHQRSAKGEPLTAQMMNQLYHELNQDYFGPEMKVDEEIDHEWERIPHFYTPFYVYQYATGFAAAVAISSRILKGVPGALEGYRKFLQGGCSMPPIELLKLCGVDMSSPEPLEEAMKVFDQLLQEFTELKDQRE